MTTCKKTASVCANCAIVPLCVTLGLHEDDLAKIDALITERKTLQKGELLFSASENYTGIYVVRSGSFKLVEPIASGEERLMMFYYPGELFGFDALGKQHRYHCVALETSSVCQIALEKLFSLASTTPALQQQLLALMGREISYVPLINLNATAEQRVIKFVLSLSERAKRRGLSGSKLHLSMSREELGAYLGLASETILRVFKKLETKKLLVVHLRDIELLDQEALIAIEQGL